MFETIVAIVVVVVFIFFVLLYRFGVSAHKKNLKCDKCKEQLYYENVTKIEDTGDFIVGNGPAKHIFHIHMKCPKCGAKKYFRMDIATETWESGHGDDVIIRKNDIQKEVKEYFKRYI